MARWQDLQQMMEKFFGGNGYGTLQEFKWRPLYDAPTSFLLRRDSLPARNQEGCSQFDFNERQLVICESALALRWTEFRQHERKSSVGSMVHSLLLCSALHTA